MLVVPPFDPEAYRDHVLAEQQEWQRMGRGGYAAVQLPTPRMVERAYRRSAALNAPPQR